MKQSRINKEVFFQNLRLTQIYCERRIRDQSKSVARILRSFNLKYQNKNIFDFEWNEGNMMELVSWNFEILDHDCFLMKKIFQQQISQKKALLKNIENRTFKGRIFVADIESTIIDGASEIESKGLIDIYDLPPIDSWFYRIKKNNNQHIFAWIPESLELEANDAIEVNGIENLFWLSNSEQLFYNKSN